MAEKILLTSPFKSKKIDPSECKNELREGLDTLLKSRTLGRDFGNILLQALWLQRSGNDADQAEFARLLSLCLQAWTAGRRILFVEEFSRKGGSL